MQTILILSDSIRMIALRMHDFVGGAQCCALFGSRDDQVGATEEPAVAGTWRYL